MSCINIGRDAVEPNILKLIARPINIGRKSSNFIIIMCRIKYYQVQDTSKHENGSNQTSKFSNEAIFTFLAYLTTWSQMTFDLDI